MSSFREILRKVSCRFNDEIQKACNPLFEALNLNQFLYYKIKSNGSFTFLGNYADWYEYFESEQFHINYPYFRDPKYQKSGIVLLKEVQDSLLEPSFNAGRDKFNLNISLKVMHKTDDCIESFGFSSSSANERQTAILLNAVPLFRLFVKKFREENRALFSRLEDTQTNIAKLIGPSFYERSSVMPELPGSNFLLGSIGIEAKNCLTPHEVAVTRLMLKGYSASQIGRQLFRSKRTIEHRIEKIKDKLLCRSKRELMQKAQELEQFGCLENNSHE